MYETDGESESMDYVYNTRLHFTLGSYNIYRSNQIFHIWMQAFLNNFKAENELNTCYIITKLGDIPLLVIWNTIQYGLPPFIEFHQQIRYPPMPNAEPQSSLNGAKSKILEKKNGKMKSKKK